jgi:hypothetical protein
MSDCACALRIIRVLHALIQVELVSGWRHPARHFAPSGRDSPQGRGHAENREMDLLIQNPFWRFLFSTICGQAWIWRSNLEGFWMTGIAEIGEDSASIESLRRFPQGIPKASDREGLRRT